MAETKTVAPAEGPGTRFWNWLTETQVWTSVFRHGRPDTDRNRVLVMLSNVFLHLHPVRIRKSGVKLRYTWCMGGLSFFLFLSLGPPHFPYDTAPERNRRQFAAAEIRLRPNVPENRREEATRILRGYYAHMAALDECLTRLLSTLDRARRRRRRPRCADRSGCGRCAASRAVP